MPVTCCVAPGSSVSSDCSLRRRPAPVPAMGHVQFRNAFHDGDVTKPARATHTGSPPGARPPLAPRQGSAARPRKHQSAAVWVRVERHAARGHTCRERATGVVRRRRPLRARAHEIFNGPSCPAACSAACPGSACAHWRHAHARMREQPLAPRTPLGTLLRLDPNARTRERRCAGRAQQGLARWARLQDAAPGWGRSPRRGRWPAR
jgi:hypothetical protein